MKCTQKQQAVKSTSNPYTYFSKTALDSVICPIYKCSSALLKRTCIDGRILRALGGGGGGVDGYLLTLFIYSHDLGEQHVKGQRLEHEGCCGESWDNHWQRIVPAKTRNEYCQSVVYPWGNHPT